MKGHKSFVILVAGFAIALTLQGCQGCRKPSGQTGNSTQASVSNTAQATPKPTRILNKLPTIINGEPYAGNGDDLVQSYSPQYAAAYQSITAKTNSIADPQLRGMAISDAWRQYGDNIRASWREEAIVNFKQEQSKFWSDNKDKLFEIGRIEPITGEGLDCDPESRNGYTWVNDAGGNRLLELCRSKESLFLHSHIALKISIPDLDSILSRFDSLSSADVQACVDALYARNRDLVEKEIAESGMPRDEAMAQAREEGRKDCLKGVRENLRVLAQGDYLHKTISNVFIMDYKTENVLAEFPATDTVGLDDAGHILAEPTTE